MSGKQTIENRGESGTADQGVRKRIKAKDLDRFLNTGITARAKASVRREQVGTPAIAIKLNLNPHSFDNQNPKGAPPASSSILLRFCCQHEQFALVLSELIHIAQVIGECRHHCSGQSVCALRRASSRFH